MTHRFHLLCRCAARRLPRWRRGAVPWLLVIGSWLLCFSLVQAQQASPAPPPAPVVSVSRSWYLEAVIVVVMFGLALYVVCRSSRRN